MPKEISIISRLISMLEAHKFPAEPAGNLFEEAAT